MIILQEENTKQELCDKLSSSASSFPWLHNIEWKC